ncbi:MAG: hypothetical protein JWO33_1219 [Caulobacteraceae bacterium]|nr:hypothetical protein [Caulobacteraceae bacterium]
MSRHASRAALLACAAIAAAALPDATLAQTPVMDAAQSRQIVVAKDKSVALRLDGPAGEIVVAQPSIAEIVATTDRSFYVRGKALGTTNILVYDAGRRLTEVIDVRVGADTVALQSDIAANFPNENITARPMGDGFILTGTASNTSVANRAVALAERYAPKAVSSSLAVSDPQQVVLEVRIVEANRSALKDFGFNIVAESGNVIFASGSGLIAAADPAGMLTVRGRAGNTTIDATLRALEEKGVLHTLARPNLAAASGQEASFLAGGEFPFPVPNGRDMIAIEFRPFGVNLKFTPNVLDNGFIRLKVAPEVSQLDSRQTLRINGLDVPSLTVRRVATTLDLRDGQSFAIAGLFQQEYTNSLRQIPGLGDVPVLGALFRSGRWKRQETELVVIVTARMTGPVEVVVNPLAGAKEATTGDLLLRGAAIDRPISTPVGGEGPQSISDLLRTL